MIKDFTITIPEGTFIKDFFVLRKGVVKQASNGSMYLDAQISDSSGSVNGKFWNYQGTDTLKEGGFAFVTAILKTYQGSPQLDIKSIAAADPLAIPTDRKRELVPCAPEDPKALMEETEKLIASISCQKLQELVGKVYSSLGDKLVTYPAAKSVHHDEVGGLIQHTVEVARTVDALHQVYHGSFNRDITIAGALLHDVGKMYEFAIGETGLVSEYSCEGQLLGHIYIGTELVGQMAKEVGLDPEKTMLLKHLLLSHHGELEFGSPVTPKTLEAFMLSQADMISSRVDVYQKATANLEPGEFSDKVYALEGRQVYKTL